MHVPAEIGSRLRGQLRHRSPLQQRLCQWRATPRKAAHSSVRNQAEILPEM